MVNLIVNVTATGSFQEAPNVPDKTQQITLQARTAVVMEYRYRNQVTYFTIKSGDTRVLNGKFNQGDLFVQAGNGVIIEIEYGLPL